MFYMMQVWNVESDGNLCWTFESYGVGLAMGYELRRKYWSFSQGDLDEMHSIEYFLRDEGDDGA